MKIKESHFIIILQILFFAFFGYLIISSESAYGGADNYSHYRISHFAWKYPKLFLDHWGKPLFTILSSPFSQFGFKGLQFFNLILGFLTSIFAYLTLKKINYSNSWFVIIFILFTPIYLIILVSGLTEILFGFIIILSVYLFYSKRYIASAIVLSFIIFSRTEGFLFFPIFIFACLFEKKYKAVPFIAFGFVVFSLLGYFILNDFWWFFTKNPYSGGSTIYGSGELLHFIKNTSFINGIPLAILFTIGLVSYLLEIIKLGGFSKKLIIEISLILSGYIIYLSAHSFVWWKGMGASLGLIRVMSAVMPLAAIVSLHGFNLIYTKIGKNKYLKYTLMVLVGFLIIRTPFEIYKIPVKRDAREKVLYKSASWLKESKYKDEKVYYYDTYFCHLLGVDPYDPESCQERIPLAKPSSMEIPIGCIVQWDAQFSPVSGKLPLDSLLNNERYMLLESFKPEVSFTTFAGYNYEVHLFQKVKY